MEASRCPSTDEWIKKLQFIYTMEYYSAIKMNTFDSVLIMRMNLEPIIQSKVGKRNLEPIIQSEVRKRKINIVY